MDKRDKRRDGADKSKKSEKDIMKNTQKNKNQIKHERIWREKKGRPPAPIMSDLIKAAAGAAG